MPRHATQQVHAGYEPAAPHRPVVPPIHQTTAFRFPDHATAASMFRLETPGFTYSRTGNPTVAVFENRLAALEGGIGAIATATGQAAVALSLLALLQGGKHLVASSQLYGGTVDLLTDTFADFGIEVTFADPADPPAWAAAVRPDTRAFFLEAITNPLATLPDLPALADLAHAAGVPVVVDSTLATPALYRPLEHGADVVTHSATKYLGGHAAAIAGVIVDAGTFDYAQHAERYPGFNEPDESYHGLVYARDLGVGSPLGANLAFILKARVQLLRDYGSAISPFNAFLVNLGLETLSLRMERQVANAAAVARWLEGRDDVEHVVYAGLESSPWHERAQRYLPKGAGAFVSFEIAGGREAGAAFVDGLTLHHHVANIGDVRSLVVHPASTTHSQLTDDEQRAAGVTPGLVRLSLGVEDIEDILADLERGFRALETLRTGA